MLLRLLLVCAVLSLPTFASGHYKHGKKNNKYALHDEDDTRFDQAMRTNNYGHHKTEFKRVYEARKHNSNHKQYNQHAKTFVKNRRSVDVHQAFETRYQESGRQYAVTTEYPFNRKNAPSFDTDIKRLQEEHEKRKKNIHQIREDLTKRFDSYSWRHSFTPEIWSDLFEQVEHSVERIRKLHEEQRRKMYREFSNSTPKRKKNHKVQIEDDYSSERRDKKDFYASIKYEHELRITSERPFYGNHDRTVMHEPDDASESHQININGRGDKEMEINVNFNKRKDERHPQHRSNPHDQQDDKPDHNNKHKTNFHFHYHHPPNRHHNPSLGSYGHYTRPSNPTQKPLCPHHHHSNSDEVQLLTSENPKASLADYTNTKCSQNGLTTENYHEEQSLHIEEEGSVHHHTESHDNVTSENPDKVLFARVTTTGQTSTSKKLNGTYAVMETSQEATITNPHITVFGTARPYIPNIDDKQLSPGINTSNSAIHFPDNEKNIQNKNSTVDPCKNGGVVEIPLLNINLPCGDLTANGGHPDDYYKREFATSMTNVFHDFLEKEKEEKENEGKTTDIDVRLGRSRRSVKNDSEIENSKKSFKADKNATINHNASVFGEIMDVPTNLSNKDNKEYFNLSMLSDYFLETVDNLDENSLVEVLVDLREDYLSKSPGDRQVVDEVYDKLVSSLLEYKRSNAEWTRGRSRRQSQRKARAQAAAALELLAETQRLESEQQDDPLVEDNEAHHTNREHELESNENPSFLELVSLADKHKSKA